MSAQRSRIPLLLVVIATLSACATYRVAPDDCPDGTQKLEGCPPLGAVDDAEIGQLFVERTWVDPAELDIDPIALGRDAEIPINRADAKFIGSTDAGGLTSLAAKMWRLQSVEKTG